MKKLILPLLLFFIVDSFAQPISVYPTNWWTGMKHNKVQLLVKGSDVKFNTSTPSVKHAGVTIDQVHRLENGKYFAIDITISPTAVPGNVTFDFINGKKKQSITWPLKSRDTSLKFAQGVTSEDLIYLIMPDRFSNGDPSNDKIKNLKDQSLNRDSIFDRHGGDIQGIINHLDYLQDLGVTAIWLTPVFENDMPNRTEHGYAITNHYKIESRLGTNALYRKFSEEVHKRNMKLVQDAVYNHVGLYHFFVQEKPTKDWLHEWPSYTNTTYKDQPLMDMYAAEADKKRMSDGWFTRMMPDLNQHNPYVANFLIQHALWTVEEFGVDGWRVDTYIYNDLEFMNRCNQALMDEYPNISIFGETWVHGVAAQAYFTQHTIDTKFKSNLPAVTDFQTNLYGIMNAINEPFGWTNGVNKLYTTLAQDFLYKDPMRNVVFLDNHDLSRVFSIVGEDIGKLKLAIAWLLTTRGVPQLYYGTEILMKGFTNPDGLVRKDFLGGWAEDKINKFTPEGRTAAENDVFNWTKALANFRKNSSAIKSGKLTQFVPEDGIYVYFRHDEKQTVMCIMNTSDQEKTIDLKRFAESIKNFTKGKEVATGKSFDVTATLKVPKQYLLVMDLN
ncbi:glycoside hydrolase family 13 protein [Pseudochryseolinea flava]|uniref:Alpha-amylase n=1 Tax=Pseudochryseolinea flava TaxID=2059302 RepID=A0A364Y334_9BACT|nr:glycoside hydrolase family 13 protein [Pseudochryseolinea flava]RAW01206.1 alpha-amylase [Pseudochryseolinea flava]